MDRAGCSDAKNTRRYAMNEQTCHENACASSIQGRILADAQKLSEYLSKYDERTTTSDMQLQDANGKEKETQDRQVTWLHCSVGAELADGEEEGDGTSQVSATKFGPLGSSMHYIDSLEATNQTLTRFRPFGGSRIF